MAKARFRRLVIDADIARSASETEHPLSSACRAFLNQVRDSEHHVVITNAISSEWRRHHSVYARKWLVSMWGRKLVDEIEIEEDAALRTKVIDAVTSRSEKNAVAKDLHLIEAALVTDKLVASRDETVRAVFKITSNSVKDIRRVVWVNPTKEGETPIKWLREGAKSERHRQLGAS